jgi:hypothetical protein
MGDGPTALPGGGPPETPAVTATPAYILTGTGFLPDHEVTVRITYNDDEFSDFLTCTTDAGGRLWLAVPSSPRTAIWAATDHRSTPGCGNGGELWSNTCLLPAPATAPNPDPPH